MKVILFIMLCLCLGYLSEGKRFSRCEFYKIAKSKLEGVGRASAADWTCLVESESNYNTAATNNNGGRSSDYGIFQINSKYWCNDGKTAGAVNGCGIQCSRLLDDNINDDIECVKKIAKQAKGLSPWRGWQNRCRGKDLRKYRC